MDGQIFGLPLGTCVVTAYTLWQDPGQGSEPKCSHSAYVDITHLLCDTLVSHPIMQHVHKQIISCLNSTATGTPLKKIISHDIFRIMNEIMNDFEICRDHSVKVGYECSMLCT